MISIPTDTYVHPFAFILLPQINCFPQISDDVKECPNIQVRIIPSKQWLQTSPSNIAAFMACKNMQHFVNINFYILFKLTYLNRQLHARHSAPFLTEIYIILGDICMLPCPVYIHVTGLKLIIFLIELRKRCCVGKALNSAYGLRDFTVLVLHGAFIRPLINTFVLYSSYLRNSGD